MDKKKQTIKQVEKKIKNFVWHLKQKYDLPVKKVYLYGSYAKNKQRKWSDIDICIISSRFKNRDALSYLWQRRRLEDIDSLIAPIGFHPDDFNIKEPSPLIWEIKNSGREIGV